VNDSPERDSIELGNGTSSTAHDSIVRGFTDFAIGVRYDDLDDTTTHAAKRCVLDALGCALGSFDFAPVVALRDLARTSSSSRPATLFGTDETTTPEMAALVNGAMIRTLDFNDDYFGAETTNAKGDTGPHPSDNLGGVLAAAQMAGATGAAALLGVVIAYEVAGQLVDEIVIRANGWDHPIIHSVATAAASSRLLGVSATQMEHALRLAVVPNICLYETRVGHISNWKGLAGPNGSRSGLFATLLAEAGITGPELAFEGPRGFMNQVGHHFSLGAFGGPGRPFRIENTYFKQFPLRYEMQLPVQMAFALREDLDPGDIASMTVYMERKSVTTREKEPSLWRPDNRETADHSGPYLIAAALVDGEITEASFSPTRYEDESILDVADAITLVEDPAFTEAFPWSMSCRFEIATTDGRHLTIVGDRPKGHPGNPLSDAELSAKFMAQAAPRIGADNAQQLHDLIWSLESEPSLDRLFALMEVPAH
jgi:2-methylcitrate dehydratase